MKHEYTALGHEEAAEAEQERNQEQESEKQFLFNLISTQRTRTLRFRNGHMLIIILATLFFALGTILGAFLEQYRKPSPKNNNGMGSSTTGYTTEKLLPPAALHLSIKTFVSGNPLFLPNGTELIQLDPLSPKYVGEPSPLIDSNWKYILNGRYFPISKREAQTLFGQESYKQYIRNGPKNKEDWNTISGGFDTFHSLHCLNELRKRFYPSSYPPTDLHGPIHDHHCINHLRQVLQCSSVATIIPSLYRPTIGIQYSDAGAETHVCRNFNAMLNFTRERYGRLGNGVLGEWREGVV